MVWSEWRPWDGQLAPGWCYSGDLEQVREDLYKEHHMVPAVAVTHKGELRKLSIQLGKERLTIAREPEHAEEIAACCEHFGLEYHGSTLCAAVGAVKSAPAGGVFYVANKWTSVV